MSRFVSSRRQFLRRLSGAALSLGLLSTGFVLESRAGSARPQSLDRLSVDAWKKLRGQRFGFRDEQGIRHSLRLAEVADRSHLTRDEGITQISLLFVGGSSSVAQQDVGLLTHPEYSGSRLLAVPVARPSDNRGSRPIYEVAFSRFDSSTPAKR